MDNIVPSITFSHEELALLLWALRVPAMPGMGDPPFRGLDEPQVRLLLGAAERSLQARRIIQINPDESLTIESAALALVGPCAIPESSVIASYTQPGSLPEIRYFHAAQSMTVEHAVTGVGLHSFAALQGPEALLERIALFLRVEDQPAASEVEGSISEGQLQQSREAAHDDGEAPAFDILVEAGLPETLATSLAHDLAHPISSSSVVAIQHRAEGHHSEGFALLEGNDGLWILRSDAADPDRPMIAISGIASDGVRAELERLILAA